MHQILIIRYGEISLKGFNRYIFEDKLIQNLKNALKHLGRFSIVKGDSRIYLEPGDFDPETLVAKVSRVFGVVSVSLATVGEPDMDAIYELALQAAAQAHKTQAIRSFKIQTRRGEKQFPYESLEISRMVGAKVWEAFPQWAVDVHHPDLVIYVEVRKQAYVYTEKIPGPGGMPYTTNGKGLLLLSGGIDSPVAGWMMAKRGVELEALHFHSYPFTSERAQEKVDDLTRILSRYCRRITLHSVNLLAIQQQIKANCKEDYFTILSRRLMMFIAERVALSHDCQALITGENIGQVASQTMQSLHVTNAAVQIPVFRPLLAMDKMEIVDWAVKIGTYEVSVQPYEDCCTVFLPKRPVTKPQLEKVLELEAGLPVANMVENALAEMETRVITPA